MKQKKEIKFKLNGKQKKGMSNMGIPYDTFFSKHEIKELGKYEIRDETTKKVHRKLEVIYYYVWYGLKKKHSELTIKNEAIKKDVDFLLAVRKYLNMGKKGETFKELFEEIRKEVKNENRI